MLIKLNLRLIIGSALPPLNTQVPVNSRNGAQNLAMIFLMVSPTIFGIELCQGRIVPM